MKKYIPFVLMILLAISLGGNIWQYIDNPKNTKFQTEQSEHERKTEKVLLISDVKMALDYDWSVPQGSAVLKLDFFVENISNEPQTIYSQSISVFDYNNCRFDFSSTLHSKINPLMYSEDINPKTRKPLSLIFEVPRDELYCIGYSETITSEGNQIFTDKIRKIKCEYETFDEMLQVRKNSVFVDISKPKMQEQVVEIEFLR